ncbi:MULTISPECIES: hypothetical protein [unclassified Janthinobacterium]|uniref:hypothetical protein n=1 Tax=unclassified Janthinobacterium TaxID=2610881 RepID=UPI00160B653C|nr:MULTISPECIES: hypothetical protein [unclassified Janthinobacterium]MBB5368103.1 hypothetical protein [Janthinobacterium sp. K2C7]MBB5379419.1 hypothetical protein [Janthinobacterium sp. K2Li3]MBB5386485.1 hypothetical protein [Janthinobacterium sp. K2E3]
MLYLLAFAIVFGLLYYVFSGRTPVKPLERALISVRQYVPEIPAGTPAHHWSDNGRYASEVENDSIYQSAIARLAGNHGPGNADEKCLALLVCDDANPFQDKAIAVFIDGQLVGYLAHNDALRLRRNLGRQDLVGQLTSCDAVIRGGGLWNGKRLAYAVWLDLQPYN